MEKIEALLKKDEKILWKKCEIFNYHLESIKNLTLSLSIILGLSILSIYSLITFLASNFNPLLLVIFIFLVIMIIIPSIFFLKDYKEMKRQRAILPKEELKKYLYCSIFTNMRYIHKHLKNFEKDYVAKTAITISDYKDDMFSVNLDNIKMVGAEYINNSECNLYFYSVIDFNFPLTLFIELTLQELINAMKILNNLLQFEQEEHHINGGILYIRSKQAIPENFASFFKPEKNNIKSLSDVIKIKK